MTIMNTELYEALKEAGASDEKAKAASNVVEEQNKRFDKIDNRFDVIQSDINRSFDKVDHRFDLIDKKFEISDNKIDNVEKRLVAELTTIKWIGGIIIGGLVAVLARLVFFAS